MNIPRDAVLVPVPMHWMRRFTRGRNHARCLALAVGKRLALPTENLLVKTKNTRQQARLSGMERRHDLTGSYRALPVAAGKTVVLIDDVYTTGTTAYACAKALADAGAKRVYVATYAKAE